MLGTLAEAQQLTVQSLQAYGSDRSTWVVGFSGGKDSTATVTFMDWAISKGLVQRPENLILVYSDTLMELPSLEDSAHRLMAYLQGRGWQIRRSVPALETKPKKVERFFVTMLGRGYPPPHNKFRWCTTRMKTAKIDQIYQSIAVEYGEDFLGIDGIRKGESAARDSLILASCSTDDGECGQGWFHNTAHGAKLSPILHWRVCQVWDWIIEACFEHGYPIDGVIQTYGVDITDDGIEEPLSARTGCIGCPLVTTGDQKRPRPDKALATVVGQEAWSHLAPFQRLSEIYWRLRWDDSFRHHKTNGQKGCLTLAAREWALGEILAVQAEAARLALELGRKPYTLIAEEEVALIRQMIADRTFPDPSRYGAHEFTLHNSSLKGDGK
nr:phosphoadenosine phosphosulfate reductase family protein [Nodosilinea sp. FACHB-131]